MALTSLTWGFHPYPLPICKGAPLISALGLQFFCELYWMNTGLQFNHSHACEWPQILWTLIPTCRRSPFWPQICLITMSLTDGSGLLVEPCHHLELYPACLAWAWPLSYWLCCYGQLPAPQGAAAPCGSLMLRNWSRDLSLMDRLFFVSCVLPSSILVKAFPSSVWNIYDKRLHLEERG